MRNRKRILAMGLLGGLLVNFIIIFVFVNFLEASSGVYVGQVVGIEFSVLQVRSDDGRVSVFWCGHKTLLESRPPFLGDRVRIEYIKDSLRRNAVTRITVVR